MMPFGEGVRLGIYEIKATASGSFAGEIYRARDTLTGRDVFLRVLTRSFSGLEENLPSLSAAAAHPNVLPVREIAASGETLFAVSDFFEGETLRQKLHRTRLPRERASHYAIQIARALASIHGTGIMHGDLKPESILITKEGAVKVMDAGLANLQFPELPSEEPANAPLPILIADYASPEQVRGEPETWRSDIFSWGVILYEMLSGTRPFLRPTLPATTRAILNDEVRELKASALDRILRQALRKDPAQRFDSARDMAFAMESFGQLTTPANRIRKTVHSSLTAPFLIAVAMLTLGLAAGALIARRYLRPTVVSQIEFRPLTFSGSDSSPSASRDGKTIVFVSDRDGTPRIWTLQMEQQAERPLTEGPDRAPRISPDGSTVLFLRGSALYTVPTQGGVAHNVRDNVEGADWSPDANQIAWIHENSLGLADATGANPKELARIPDRVLQSPRWSPDGKYIAASVAGAIVVIRADEPGTPHILQPPPNRGALSTIAWLHGSQIVYLQSIGSGAADIVRQDVETGSTTSLGVTQQSAANVDVLGPGSLIFDGDSGLANLEEVNLASGQAIWLTAAGRKADEPMYSADGKRLYFSSSRAIWMRNTQTGAYTRVIAGNGNDFSPFLAASGKQIYWSSSREGHPEVFSANLDGSSPRRLTSDGKDAQHPSLPSAEDWLVYNSTNPERSGVWKIKLTGLDGTQIAKGDTRWPEASPDGRYVLYTAILPAAREIRVVSLENGAPVSFHASLSIDGNPSLGRAKWMPDSKSIAFIGEDDERRSGVYVQPLNGPRRKLGGFMAGRFVESFALSPDGTRLTIAADERSSELMQASNVPGVGR